jgi:HAD superfamily hydrolase (TIGR01548 family)
MASPTTFPPATTLLLDMDGVLAEVSKSYRASIISTCHSFGATSVTNDVISECKAKGGCNNDWVLSLDLIKIDPNGTKNVTLEEVTETFEKFYQGEGETKGLFELETLIPTMNTMKELKRKVGTKIAIVTGRPRRDCMKFLKLHSLDTMVDVCVCMEDGPPKPDPFPIVEALKLLNIKPSKEVIMVGDTPDDIRAAIACGCRGVGVATPESVVVSKKEGRAHDTCKLSIAMKECGADVVLEPGFEELVGMFKEP